MGTASPSLWACRMEDLVRLVGLQRETLNVLERKLEAYEAELHLWDEGRRAGRGGGDLCNGVGMMEEILRLEKHLRKNEVEMEEEEFWATELQIELESERQLEDRLQELRMRLQGCEQEIHDKMAMVQFALGCGGGSGGGAPAEGATGTQWVTAAEARAQVLRVKTELKAQERQAVQLEGSCRALDRSPDRADMQQELEQLTKELRQVNLQQFIRQTGTKVTVLPAEPTDEESAPNSRE
ncbi:hypothetical protein WMY93_023059 [Mugilogobius chulae]|uniref:Uncharacterized protein n=1 Tax=Mugilogobius chulae TaxID=88201 RepID=A0AAW0N4T6_9GOBI